MRILLIGDTHIPDKKESVPDKFLDEARRCDLVICTGDITDKDTLDSLLEASKVRAVKGEDDYMNLPEQDLVQVEKMKFGVVHGHRMEGEDEMSEELMEFADMLKADVLVTGHTHKPFRTEKNGKVLLNPGSATGVDTDKKTCMVVEVQGTDIQNCEILTSEE